MSRAAPNHSPRSSGPATQDEPINRRWHWRRKPSTVPTAIAPEILATEIEHRWLTLPELFAEREAPYCEVA